MGAVSEFLRMLREQESLPELHLVDQLYTPDQVQRISVDAHGDTLTVCIAEVPRVDTVELTVVLKGVDD